MDGSDAAEVAQALAGDQDAFRALVDRHSRSIFRLAYRMTGNEHDAEEVVQETFLRAYKRLGDFEERASFKTWVYRIAMNCSLDLVRGRRRVEDRRETEDAEGNDPLAAIPAANPGPERLLLSGELRRKVETALGKLGPLERAAFVMRHYEGQSIEEIGKALGLRTSATKNNIFRAVQKLRRALEPLVTRA
jgi:RNA polymerase sigma-70 factor (ECF subfamily)